MIGTFRAVVYLLPIVVITFIGGFGCQQVPPQGTKEIQGVVFYGLVSGATVRVSSLTNGTVLDTVQTDANGSFVADLPAGELEEGFRVQVSGGTVGENDLEDDLSAIYIYMEAEQGANVTAMTTLIAEVADSGLVGGTNSLARRDAAINLLAERDLLTTSTWANLEPQKVLLESIQVQAEDAGGLDTWTDEFIADLQDGELAPEFLAVFPHAHGGILAIHTGGSGFPGQAKQMPIIVQSTNVLSEDYAVELLEAPSGLHLNGKILEYTIPESAPPGLVPFELAVTHRTSGLGRTVRKTIVVLEGEVLGEALIGTSGGTLTDLWDEIVVNIPAGVFAGETLVRLVKGFALDGAPIYTAFKPGAPDPLPASVTLSLPNPNLIVEREAGSKSLDGDEPGVIRCFNARFVSDIRLADNRLPESSAVPAGLIAPIRRAAQLVKHCEISGQPCDDNREPVLFVHGYQPRVLGLGGGEGTWGEFPSRLQAAEYQCYEFQYFSSARFQDLAADLASSIGTIAARHGKKVHIIAHSFGGLVARTYLQDLASPLNAGYAGNVASLTTVGTPHSGIFSVCGQYGGRTFPSGKGSNFIEFARQLSTYQAGERAHLDKKFLGIDFDSWFLSEEEMLAMYQIDSEPGEIAIQLSDFGRNPYPDVPTQVLVGLQDSYSEIGGFLIGRTDGLISFHGQRFHPSFSSDGTQCVTRAISSDGLESTPIQTIEGNRFGAILQEKLLGLSDRLKPGDSWPTDGEQWSHSSFVRTPGSSLQVRTECDGASGCGEVYDEAKMWLETWQAGPQFSPAMTIRGRLLRAQDFAPVIGAEITVFLNGVVTDGTAYSDSDGFFDLETLFFGPGTYTLGVDTAGFHFREHDVDLNLDAPNASVYQVGEIYLYEESGGRGSLSGYATDRFSGQTLDGVRLRITNDERPIDTETNANGYYFVPDLAAGAWRIYAAVSGYRQPEPAEIVVLPETSNDGPVVLTPDDISGLQLPEVRTWDPDDHGWVGNVCARVGGYIVNDGGAAIADIQLGWGATSDGSDWEYVSGGASSRVDVVLDVLEPGDRYYTRAFARNIAFPEDWASGSRFSFRTDNRLGLADVTVPLSRISTTQGFREGHSYYTLSGITNLGDETIQHAVCEIYLATDSDHNTSDDHLIDTFEVSNIPPCGTQWVRTDFVMPDLRDVPSGEYQVKFSLKLDAYDEVEELSENNEWQTIGWYSAIDAGAKGLPVGVPPVHLPLSLNEVAAANPDFDE